MNDKIFRKDYFEAIIQLRPFNQDVLDFIKKQVESRAGVFITKIIPQKKAGIDIYLTDQRFAKSIGKKLKKFFKGELKLSKALYGKNRISSKLMYRATVLFRLKQ